MSLLFYFSWVWISWSFSLPFPPPTSPGLLSISPHPPLLFCLSCSIRPNIFVGRAEGTTQYLKWYFEVMVDEVVPFLTAQATHLRVGWALTEGYSPYPGGGEGWGGNGVGDDLYSYGFDGLHLWTGTWTLLGDPQP